MKRFVKLTSMISIQVFLLAQIGHCSVMSIASNNSKSILLISNIDETTLAPKFNVQITTFQNQFQEITNTQFKLNSAKDQINQAIQSNDFDFAWAVYNQEIESQLSGMYLKEIIRFDIEKAESDYNKNAVLAQAKQKHLGQVKIFQEKFQLEGAAAFLKPLIEQGKKYSERKITHALALKTINAKLVETSQIENLRLISDGVFAREDVYAARVGKGVAGELVLSNGAKINFLAFFNVEGGIEKIFIRRHWEFEDQGEFAGHDPQDSLFVAILNTSINVNSLSGEVQKKIEAINSRIKKEALQLEMISHQVSDKSDDYQIFRPAIHDKLSRQYLESNLNKTPGLDMLGYFISNSKMPIPVDVVKVRNLSHPKVKGLAGGLQSEGIVYTADKVFPKNTFIHETVHSFFEDLDRKLGNRNTFKIITDEFVFERDTYKKLRKYFLSSHFHNALKKHNLYSFIYDKDGKIVKEYNALTESLAYTTEAILSFRGYALGVKAKLQDVKFLVDIGLLPKYMFPDSLNEKFEQMADKGITIDNYYLPMAVSLYQSGEKEQAESIFNEVTKSTSLVVAALKGIENIADVKTLKAFVFIAAKNNFAKLANEDGVFSGLDRAILDVILISYKHRLDAEGAILWDLYRKAIAKTPRATMDAISSDLPAAVNKALVREFLSHATDKQIADAKRDFIFRLLKEGGRDSFFGAIITALEKRDHEVLPGDESFFKNNVVGIRGPRLNAYDIAIDQAI